MKPPVVILCGGRGTRLREETEIRPKPMVDIGGRPILWHIMKIYASYGYCDFILALGYKGEYIKEYFYNYRISANDFTITLTPCASPIIHTSSGEDHWRVTCIDTGENTLKGGRIKRLEPYITGERFHLTYGDGVSDINIDALDQFHRGHGLIGTVSAVRPPSRFGEMLLNGDLVTRFEEKPQLGTGIINGGFFVFTRRFLDYLTADENCDFEFGALQRLAADNQLKAFRHTGFWQCMDTLRDRDHLNRLWAHNRAPWKLWESP